MTPHHPNLLGFRPHRPSVLLRVATLVSVGAAGVMVWMFVMGPTPWIHRTASIADTFSETASASAGLSPTPVTPPKLLGATLVTAVAVGLAPDTIRYYEVGSGKAFSIDLHSNTVTTLSAGRLAGFVDSIWAPGRNAVISQFTTKGTSELRSFDYTTKKTTTIGSGASAAAISPDGSRVVFLQSAGDASLLGIADTATGNTHTLVTTRAQSVRLSWPTATSVFFSSQRPDRAGKDLTLVSMDGSLTPVMTNRQNLDYVWSHDGSRLLFSYFVTGQGVTLWLRDVDSGSEVPLGLLTSAHKCAWAPGDTTIVCGIPSGTSLSATSTADQTATNDDIVVLDLTSAVQQTIYHATSAVPLGVIDPVISSSGTYFVFTNIFDQKLYSISF